MYKLFLCLNYLRKRALAYFAMLGVALCVFMMLVAVSVLNGFVAKIEHAAKGLFGDVVISASSLGGLTYYDEFIGEMKRKVPAVRGASPFILTFGILRVPGTDYRRTVQVAGIRLPERAEVSDFEEGLFVQAGVAEPSFDPPMGLLLRRLDDEYAATRKILQRETNVPEPQRTRPEQVALISRIGNALSYQKLAILQFADAESNARRLAFAQAVLRAADEYGDEDVIDERLTYLQKALATTDDANFLRTVEHPLEHLRKLAAAPVGAAGTEAEADRQFLKAVLAAAGRAKDDDLINRELQSLRILLATRFVGENDRPVRRLERRIDMWRRSVILPPEKRAILGLGIAGLTSRTPQGETIRTIGPGQQIVLSLLPLGRQISYADITPVTERFTVIDDCSTDVASIDSEIVYVEFKTLQKLNNMAAERDADDPNRLVGHPRCSQIHVKVAPELSRGYQLQEVARQIDGVWRQFVASRPDAAEGDVRVETWRQRQSRLVSSIEAQRTLMVIILGIISSVAVVLIFVIMYVIVVQKTRDIGVLKAVGASSAGVAGIFLAYGAAIGLVGSAFGTLGGYYFVRNINPIHDWIGRTFGFVVWSRETFMFEKIPNEVGTAAAINIVIGAVLSGILGALIPAVRAARQQPVEALRYE